VAHAPAVAAAPTIDQTLEESKGLIPDTKDLVHDIRKLCKVERSDAFVKKLNREVFKFFAKPYFMLDLRYILQAQEPLNCLILALLDTAIEILDSKQGSDASDGLKKARASLEASIAMKNPKKAGIESKKKNINVPVRTFSEPTDLEIEQFEKTFQVKLALLLTGYASDCACIEKKLENYDLKGYCGGFEKALKNRLSKEDLNRLTAFVTMKSFPQVIVHLPELKEALIKVFPGTEQKEIRSIWERIQKMFVTWMGSRC
jgi:hypothetical protein